MFFFMYKKDFTCFDEESSAFINKKNKNAISLRLKKVFNKNKLKRKLTHRWK